MKRKNRITIDPKIRVIEIIFIGLTILCAIPKIWIGFEQDESYIVTMGLRMLHGDRLFSEMWELHMTSAWAAYLGLAIYKGITGGLFGAIIFLRIMSTVVQWILAYVVYRIMKKYWTQPSAFFMAITVANFLPRATQNFEYGWMEMIFVILAVVLLYDAMHSYNTESGLYMWEIIAAGISYSVAVLAYPTIVFSFPVLLISLYMLQERKAKSFRLPIVFGVTCAACAALFLEYVFSYLSLDEFVYALQGILSDGTHSDTVKTLTYGTQLVQLSKRFIGFAVFCFIFLVIYWLAHRCICKKGLEKKTMVIFFAVLLLGVSGAAFVILNLTGIRPSGPIGLQIRYMIATFVLFLFAMIQKEKELIWMWGGTGIAIYVGAMVGSNLGFEVNASFLYLGVLASILAITSWIQSQRADVRICGWICVVFFIMSILLSKGYLVRITGTEPANIREARTAIKDGPAAGIYVYPEEQVYEMVRWQEISEYSNEDDCMLYIGSDGLCNAYTEGRFTSASCISTPVYNELWVKYYSKEDAPEATIIFIDKNSVDTAGDFLDSEFGQFLGVKYHISESDFIEEDAFWICRTLE